MCDNNFYSRTFDHLSCDNNFYSRTFDHQSCNNIFYSRTFNHQSCNYNFYSRTFNHLSCNNNFYSRTFDNQSCNNNFYSRTFNLNWTPRHTSGAQRAGFACRGTKGKRRSLQWLRAKRASQCLAVWAGEARSYSGYASDHCNPQQASSSCAARP